MMVNLRTTVLYVLAASVSAVMVCRAHETNAIGGGIDNSVYCMCEDSETPDGSGCYRCFHVGNDTELQFNHLYDNCCDEGSCRYDDEFFFGEWEVACLPFRPLFKKQYEQIVFIVLAAISASLSALGSSFIVYATSLRQIRGHANTRDRILCLLSLIDVLNSVAYGVGPLATPKGAVDMIGAVGTTATCDTQGFFVQLGISAIPLYNAMLSVYFLLIVGYQMQVRRIVEIVLHLVPLGYGLVTSSLGAALQMYNANGNVCWLEGYPYNCAFWGSIDCTRGQKYKTYDYVYSFAAIPLSAAFLIVFVAMGLLSVKSYRTRREFTDRFGADSLNSNQVATVWTQASLYVLSFLSSYLFIVLIWLEKLKFIKLGQSWTGKFVFHSFYRFLLPLQGWWNFFVFIRPSWGRIRKAKPDVNIFAALREAMRRESIEYRPQPNGGARAERLARIMSVRKSSKRSEDQQSSGTHAAVVTSSSVKRLSQGTLDIVEESGAAIPLSGAEVQDSTAMKVMRRRRRMQHL